MASLFDDVRKSQNLFAAWRHVKRSALASSNGKIRGQAAEFEHQHQRHLRRIADQLRNGRFEFDPFEGVLKDKKTREAANKDPRPIAIGTIKNRVVQRAILQVLQPRKVLDPTVPNPTYKQKEDPRIGRLNLVNQSRFGVGGLLAPYGGVQPAIKLIMDAMDNGSEYYFQSDIKAFFTRIPTNDVVTAVLEETGDEELASIFAESLKVELANKEELVGYAKLFPRNGEGVAQGSSLSAFAGNVLLYDFDHELNSRDVTAVRYIDDIFILSASQDALDEAVAYAKTFLEARNFALYPPVDGSDKAAAGDCADGFQFLGCSIQPRRCVPSKNSVDSLLKKVRESLSSSKKSISDLIAGEGRFDPKNSTSATLDRLGKRLFGWEKSFSFSTNSQPFKYVDEQVAKLVHDYEGEVARLLKKQPINIRMQAFGIPSTAQLFERDHARRS